MRRILVRSCRLKAVESVTGETCMRRCLGVFDLVVIGMGSMVGSGIYVMSGIAAKTQAGPSLILSFVVAALVVLLVAACFTELASRLHKTGSTYLYIYLTIGELPAFLCGFGILLLCLFGAAINARALTFYADSMFNGAIAHFVEEYIASWTVGSPIARYPDFLAVVAVLVITVVVACGVECSARLSAVFVVVNIIILLFIILCGFIFGDIKNWIEPFDLNSFNMTHNLTHNYNNITISSMWEAFAPFGWMGIMRAASMCFWSYSGFEMITCAVEESTNPRRDIPLSMGIALILVMILYVLTSSSLTLMVPWPEIDVNAPLSAALQFVGLNWGRFVVATGTICGFTTALLNNVYAFGRLALAMAEDGLLPSYFGKVSSRTGVPTISVVVCGILTAGVAFCLDLANLVEFSVNLIMLSYAAVCVAIIILRYRPGSPSHSIKDAASYTSIGYSKSINGVNNSNNIDIRNGESSLPLDISCDDGAAFIEETAESSALCSSTNSLNHSSVHVEFNPYERSYLKDRFHCLESLFCCSRGCVQVAVGCLVVFVVGLSATVVYSTMELEHKVWWSILLVTVLSIGILTFVIIIAMHRETKPSPDDLYMPCIPLLPSSAILFCLMLMVANSTKYSWIGTVIVFGLAFIIYFLYSVHRSKLNDDPQELSMINGDQSCELTAHLLESGSENEEEFI